MKSKIKWILIVCIFILVIVNYSFFNTIEKFQNNRINIDHIYIICSKIQEPDRYKYISEFFKTNSTNINHTIVEPYFKGPSHNFYSKYAKHLKDGEKCICETYKSLLNDILSNTNHNHVCIFESDVIFLDNFWNNFNNVLKNYEKVYDDNSLVFISDGMDLYPDQTKKVSDILYASDKTRCLDSTIMTRKAIQNLYDYTLSQNQINDPVDHLWNKAILEKNIKVFWVHPTITLNGSIHGYYKSGIS